MPKPTTAVARTEQRTGPAHLGRADATTITNVARVLDGAAERVVGADRVLAVLRELAAHPDGIGLEEMTRRIASPKSTVHRALSSLRRAGLADQDVRGQYVLGDEFLRMAFAFQEARPDHVRIAPVLEALAIRFGETAHYAVLDGTEIVYRAKVDPPAGAVKLTSTVGGRNPAHATAVGKLLLAHRLATLPAVTAWVGGRTLAARTPATANTPAKLHRELGAIRACGYSVDNEENEFGVNCLALPVYVSSPSIASGAISISALSYRTPLVVLVDAVHEIRAILGTMGQGPG